VTSQLTYINRTVNCCVILRKVFLVVLALDMVD